jgi:apolipoprotein N-acyltransferase
MIRADSSGYSMIVDNAGHVVAQAGLGTREIIVADVSTVARSTIYKRVGDWFLWVCAAIVSVHLVLAVRQRIRVQPSSL